MSAKRFYRSRTERSCAGVCGGLAEYFDLDPVLVRVGLVVLTLLAPPVGVIGYLVLWLIAPEDPRQTTPPARPEAAGPEPAGGVAAGATSAGPPHETPPASAPAGPEVSSARTTPGTPSGRTLGLILVVIGVWFLLGNLGVFDWGVLGFWRWRYLWPVLLIGIGVSMLARAMRPESRPRGRSENVR